MPGANKQAATLKVFGVAARLTKRIVYSVISTAEVPAATEVVAMVFP